MGTMNFGLFPMLKRFKDFKHAWEPAMLEASHDFIFRNTYKDIRYCLETLNESGAQSRSTPDLTEQYEQLRREAATRSEHESNGLGLALFLRRGMTAWMQAWAQCTDDDAPTAHSQSATAAVPSLRPTTR